MMLIILIKAHQATGSEWSSFMAEKIDDLACAFSNFSSIFSFSAWFWIIYFFSRNFASIINSAILHLYRISRCIYFDAIDIYRDPILTAKIIAVKNFEQLILNAINGLEYQNKLEDVLSDYGEEINHYKLATQLLILKTNHICSNKLYEKQYLTINSHKKLAEKYNVTRKIESLYAAFNT